MINDPPIPPEWPNHPEWKGSSAAVRAELGWALADFLDAIGSRMPGWLFGLSLQEKASAIRREWIYPPGIESGLEYAEYLAEQSAVGEEEEP